MRQRTTTASSERRTKDLMLSWMAERPDLDLTEFLLGIVIQRMGRMLEASFDRMCRSKFGISGQDMRVLFALRRNGVSNGLRPTDLFRSLLVTSGAITKQVDRLQGKGLVERQFDTGNGGTFKVFLTKKGIKAANGATEAMVEKSLLTSALRTLPSNQTEAGIAFIRCLFEALEREVDLEQRR